MTRWLSHRVCELTDTSWNISSCFSQKSKEEKKKKKHKHEEGGEDLLGVQPDEPVVQSEEPNEEVALPTSTSAEVCRQKRRSEAVSCLTTEFTPKDLTRRTSIIWILNKILLAQKSKKYSLLTITKIQDRYFVLKIWTLLWPFSLTSYTSHCFFPASLSVSSVS